ncbi:MAG: metallophosphatase family protein [Proteobacteria bacterium]|nr:metallophosphatase family protein [Pseudomonadota bacterium]MBU1641200.1 metallophosphatase family protein [Pseudomonadota bacterium]
MRLAILSDIHGNYQALKAVLADIDNHNVQQIYTLGDNIGYGPEPEQVVQALMTRGARSILGNHELALKSVSYLKRLNFVVQHSLELVKKLMSPETIAFSCALPSFRVEHGIRFVHGCPPESVTMYLQNPSPTRLERTFATYPEQYCFYGHTHAFGRYVTDGSTYWTEKVAPGQVQLNDQWRHINNVGSVGQPRDGKNNKAKYGLFDTENNSLEIRALEYDVEKTVALLAELGFHATNASRLL